MKPAFLAGGLLLLFAGAAEARPSRNAEAVLASAPAAASETVIDGRIWKCLGTGCRGRAAGQPASQPPLRECSRVAARLGELSFYRTGGRALSAAELAQCNVGAAKSPAATVLSGLR
jgi:hypothetical protein